jgi:beta-galactosidase GanA
MTRRRPLLAPFAAVAMLVALLAAVAAPSTPARAAPAPPAGHTVTYDHYSLMVDGHRLILDAAEFEYWRLPSPSLWLDVLEKLKADGFNAVSVYFNWAYHSPAPGVYDFSGVRNVAEFLRMTERVGLYVVARPGPYINAETTGGGLPGWLKTVPGRARSSAPGYTAAYTDWLHHIDAIIAPFQVTHGGTVLLYQAENEYDDNTDPAYMAAVQETARDDGIDVPIQTNDTSNIDDWISGTGAVQLPGMDIYPQSFDCANWSTVWGPWGDGIAPRLSDGTPVSVPEYQAGSTDADNVGYDLCRKLTGVDYMRYFYKSNLILSGATMLGYYMGFGGTSWGYLPEPDAVYTSYDYGAAIDENRQPTVKYDEFKLENYFLQALAPVLATTDAATAPASSNPAVRVAARVDPGTGTQFVLVRHAVPAATTTDTTTLTWTTPDGTYQVPVTVAGRTAKILVAGYDLGGQRLVYSSSEIMTTATVAGRDIAVLYGTRGEAATTVLRYSSAPAVKVLSGAATATYSGGDLRLDYTHAGLTRIEITGGGRRPLLLLIGTDQTAANFWRADTASGPVLVDGTALVRSASLAGGRLNLQADTTASGPVEVFAPAAALTVNGHDVTVRPTASGSLAGELPGPRQVALPALTGWREQPGAPETRPDFDDTDWSVGDHTTTNIPYTPKTEPVLYAEDYGYDTGDIWYRGHFTATGSESSVSMNVFTGKGGYYLVWLNGHYLGYAAGGTQSDSDTNNPDPGAGTFAVPAGTLRKGRPAVLSVLVENMGDNDDWIADDNRFKQPRGIYGVTVAGESGPITWRIAGDEDRLDPVRGPLNSGGLYGERAGWTLPGYPDASWPITGLRPVTPGVAWYRTTFALHLPAGQDVPIDLRFATPPAGYRVEIYLNGWNLGQYGGAIGPQTDFVLPAGILRTRGSNTLALAVVAQGDGPAPAPSLVAAGDVLGGVPVTDVDSPGYP